MPNQLDRLLKSVADPTRREIFNLLVVASTALSISQIADHFAISRQGVTKHIHVLAEAGLLEIHSAGRERFCKADPTPLKEIRDWVQYYEQFWSHKLDNLGKHLDGKNS